MYYNRAIECGRVSSEPAIRTSKSGKNFVTLRLGVKRGKKNEFDNFNLSAYGEVGNSILENVHCGDHICVSGPVSATGFTSTGGKVGANLMLIVMKWEMDPTAKMTAEAEKESQTESIAEEDINEEFLF